jgi:ADP-glucose pyrophosphorylase
MMILREIAGTTLARSAMAYILAGSRGSRLQVLTDNGF